MAKAISALPMESNPDTMNKYLNKLGVPESWKLVDVIGLEGDALSWVPRPVLALILLFPLSDAYEKHRVEEELKITSEENKPPKDLFYMKQVVSNACGTIALVHSIANNTHQIKLNEGLLKKYLKEASDLDASARGALLENSQPILETYKEILQLDSDANTEADRPTNHFVTFIEKDGLLYELDGRKASPVQHGATTKESFLEDAAKICREFIAREPGSIGFNVVALVPAQ